MAGQARTLASPTVHRAAYEHLTRRGAIDLFAALSTGSDGCPAGCADGRVKWSGLSFQGFDDMELAPPCELERALRLLRPVAVRFILEQPPPVCVENFATLQLKTWAACADLVQRANARGGGYEYVLRTRPDVYWPLPVELPELAAALEASRRRDVVVTHNDWHMLLHAAQLPMLAAIANASCAPRCNLCKACLFRAVFDDYNEYCVLLSHLAAHRLRHVESGHPDDPRIFHYATKALWLDSLRKGKLARWAPSQRPARQPPGTRVTCRGGPPLRCSFCGQRHSAPCAATIELAAPRPKRAPPKATQVSALQIRPPVAVRWHEAFVNSSRGGAKCIGRTAGSR